MAQLTEGQQGSAQSSRRSRGMQVLTGLVTLVVIPAALYAVHVLGQIEDVRQHDLRLLHQATQTAEGQLRTALTNVQNLADDARQKPAEEQSGAPENKKGDSFACQFFKRQPRLIPARPDNCSDFGEALLDATRDQEAPLARLRGSKNRLAIEVSCDAGRRGADDLQADGCAEVAFDFQELLGSIPFEDSFQQLLVADENGDVVGPMIRLSRSSLMQPPWIQASEPPLPVRLSNIDGPSPIKGDRTPAVESVATVNGSTRIRTLDVGGTRYSMICHPWRIPFHPAAGQAQGHWRLCGIKDSQQAFRKALQVAPNVVWSLFALLTVAILSWPILKVLSLAPQERVRYSDLFQMVFATMALIMLLTAAVSEISTYLDLRERSQVRLRTLAESIDQRLRGEFLEMHDSLRRYDAQIAEWYRSVHARSPHDADLDEAFGSLQLGCLLLSPEARAAHPGCEQIRRSPERAVSPESGPQDQETSPLTLGVPEVYPFVEQVFWVTPCEAKQFIKATARFENTPRVPVAHRPYFQKIKRDRAWSVPGRFPGPEHEVRFYVQTAASITTGDFFSALSIRSAVGDHLSWRDRAKRQPQDCSRAEQSRFVAVMSSEPVTLQYPILGPGVSFAVVDRSGQVRFHSDRRRAVVENLFEDRGIAARLQAVLATGRSAPFEANYLTRPHEVYVHPMTGLPWSVVSLVDKQVLRTFHVELFFRVIILITLHISLVFAGTVVYRLIKGRAVPPWMWPRRGPDFVTFYNTTLVALGVQIAIGLLALDLLQGRMLALYCLLMPVGAMLAVVSSTAASERFKKARMRATDPPDVQNPLGRTHDEQAVAADQLARQFAWRLSEKMTLGLSVALPALLLGFCGEFWTLQGSEERLIDKYFGTVLAIFTLLIIFAGTMALRWNWPRGGVLRKIHPLVPHVASTMLFWVIAAAIPAHGLYKVALERELQVFATVEEDFVERAQAARLQAVLEEERNLALEGVAESLLAARRAHVCRLKAYGDYELFPCGLISDLAVEDRLLRAAHNQDQSMTGLWSAYAQLAPIYNDSSAYKRYLDFPSGSAPTTDRFARPHHVDACELENVKTWRPQLGAAPIRGMDPSKAILGLSLLLVLSAWVALSVRRLFFGDVEDGADREAVRHDTRLGHLWRQADPLWIANEIREIANLIRRQSNDGMRQWPKEQALLEDLAELTGSRRAVIDVLLSEGAVAGCLAREWQRLRAPEKLVIIQLIEEGVVNPRQAEVIGDLLRSGLLKRDPNLRPMSASLALFVEKAVDPNAVAALESASEGLNWNKVRKILVAILLLVLLFLAMTQRDTVEIWLAYLGTAAAGAAGLMKMLNLLDRSNFQKRD